MLQNESKVYLEEKLIPFWNSMIDKTNGGFYGQLNFDLVLNKTAKKGCILNSRILWLYSNAYLTLGDKSYLEYARHSFDFMRKYFVDKEFDGLYWSVNFDGTPNETLKHTYNFSFGLYALSSYYIASKDENAKILADNIFNLIETKCKAPIGYFEAFTRDFKPEINEELSENGVIATRTMNTLLHVIESYNEYYLATKNNKVKQACEEILKTFENYVFEKDNDKLGVFFNDDFEQIIDLNSYGHDIEASWLLDKACEIIDDKDLAKRVTGFNSKIANRILKVAFENSALNNEVENGVVDKTRVWWVQAESILGFINEYEKNGDEKFLTSANEIWEYVKKYFVDNRPHSEWYSEVTFEGEPIKKDIVNEWKCPYHNGRMLLEVIKRNQN